MRQAPTGVLTPEARDHRVGRTDRDRPRPAGNCIIRRKSHRAKPAHTDFRDAQPGVDAAAPLCAGVNQGFPERPAGNAEVQYCGVASERGREFGSAPIDAYGLDIAQYSAS
jgi:hypothetical protein